MAKSIRKLLKSFTLIELIIVIAIIAVLGVAAFLVLTQWMSKGRDAQRISDLSTIKTALDIALSKNDELPLPDETNVLLYSGTQILYQGKLADNVVAQIGTLNKVPKDRVHGYYDYSILDDMKTYRIKANMENDQYKMSFANQVMAQEDYYRYVGKDIKGVVVLDKFIYLPSMFITGYVEKSYDLKDGSLNVFLGTKGGEVLTAGVASLDSNDIIAMLTGLGIQSSKAVEIVDQTLPQARASCEAASQTINTRIYEIGKLAHAQNSLVELSPVGTVNGKINYKQKFVCNNGTINTDGNEIQELVCNNGYINISGECKIGLVGDNTSGRSWSDGTYATSCKNYLTPESGKYYAGATGNGAYNIQVKVGDIRKVYCDMTSDGGGWIVLYSPSVYTLNSNLLKSMYSGAVANMDSSGIYGGPVNGNNYYSILLNNSTQLKFSITRSNTTTYGSLGFLAYNSANVSHWAGVLDSWGDSIYKYSKDFITVATCSTSYVASKCNAIGSYSGTYSNITTTFPYSHYPYFQLWLGYTNAGDRITLLMMR
ncbi:MAG: fibrinogen-like YCDxxxxGGGW domain-containing protein [Candidatus Absconditabacteria bacterium]